MNYLFDTNAILIYLRDREKKAWLDEEHNPLGALYVKCHIENKLFSFFFRQQAAKFETKYVYTISTASNETKNQTLDLDHTLKIGRITSPCTSVNRNRRP